MEDKRGPTEVVFTNGPEPGIKCESCRQTAHLNATCGDISLGCCGQDACKRNTARVVRQWHLESVTRAYLGTFCF